MKLNKYLMVKLALNAGITRDITSAQQSDALPQDYQQTKPSYMPQNTEYMSNIDQAQPSNQSFDDLAQQNTMGTYTLNIDNGGIFPGTGGGYTDSINIPDINPYRTLNPITLGDGTVDKERYYNPERYAQAILCKRLRDNVAANPKLIQNFRNNYATMGGTALGGLGGGALGYGAGNWLSNKFKWDNNSWKSRLARYGGAALGALGGGLLGRYATNTAMDAMNKRYIQNLNNPYVEEVY